MPSLNFFKEVWIKKKSFKLWTFKFFNICRPHWQMQVLQVPDSQDSLLYLTYCLYIRALFAELTAYRSHIIFRTCSDPSWLTKVPIRQISEVWGSGSRNCKRLILRHKNSDDKAKKVTKKSLEYIITKA